MSGGTANTPAVFRGVSSDGSRVFFETDESLLGSDSDSAKDVYLRSYGALTLVSQMGPTDGAAANFKGVLADGNLAFFDTTNSWSGVGDNDGQLDVYRVDREPAVLGRD